MLQLEQQIRLAIEDKEMIFHPLWGELLRVGIDAVRALQRRVERMHVPGERRLEGGDVVATVVAEESPLHQIHIPSQVRQAQRQWEGESTESRTVHP